MCGCIKIPRLTSYNPDLWVGGKGENKTPKLCQQLPTITQIITTIMYQIVFDNSSKDWRVGGVGMG